MPDFLKLPLAFDERQLVADCALVDADEWRPHFNTGYYEGDWSGVALLSTDGSESTIYTGFDSEDPVFETPVLIRCEYFKRVLAAFRCRIKSARLLRLGPGSAVLEHSDSNLSVADGTARIHIPICTNPLLDFRIDGHRLVMKEGEAWYINFNLPHRLRNSGQTERIHLVVDCEVNDWVAGFFPPEALIKPEASDGITFRDAGHLKDLARIFADFRCLVLEDLVIQKRLRETEGTPEFCSAIVEFASDRGFYFSRNDVNALLTESRSEWNSKWR